MKKTKIIKKTYFQTITIIFLIIALTITVKPLQQINDEEEIDQQQTIGTEEELIYNNNWRAQSFTPSKDTITQIQLKMRKEGTIINNLTVQIRTPNINGYNIATATIPNNNITTQPDWIKINFTDYIDVTPEERYYIICYTEGGDENNSYIWYQGTNTTYTRGIAYYTNDSGTNWIQANDKDFCFQTISKDVGKGDLDIIYLVGKPDFPGGRIDYAIQNTGDANLNKIYISMRLTGGLVLAGRTYTATFDNIASDQIVFSEVYPIIGLGSVTCAFSVWADGIIPITKTSEGNLFLFYVYLRP